MPPPARSPTSVLLATGAALWDARLMEADALIVRSGADFWSRPEDAAMLATHLDRRAGVTGRYKGSFMATLSSCRR